MKGNKILYRNRKGRVLPFNPWNYDIEEGDILVRNIDGAAFRAEESSGRNKRDMGELTPRRLKPPHPGMTAIIEDGKMYWITPGGRDALEEVE